MRAEDEPNENPVDPEGAGEPNPPKAAGLSGDDARAANPPPPVLPLAAVEPNDEPKAGADPDPNTGADPEPKAGAPPEPKAGADPEPKAGALPEPNAGAAVPPPKLDAGAGAGAGVLAAEAGLRDENGFFGAAADRGGKAAAEAAGLGAGAVHSVPRLGAVVGLVVALCRLNAGTCALVA